MRTQKHNCFVQIFKSLKKYNKMFFVTFTYSEPQNLDCVHCASYFRKLPLSVLHYPQIVLQLTSGVGCNSRVIFVEDKCGYHVSNFERYSKQPLSFRCSNKRCLLSSQVSPYMLI